MCPALNFSSHLCLYEGDLLINYKQLEENFVSSISEFVFMVHPSVNTGRAICDCRIDTWILKFSNVVSIDVLCIATRQVVDFDKMMAFLILQNEFSNFINSSRRYSGESTI